MKLNLLSKKEISEGIWEISFDIKNKKFSFQAGQYIRLVLPSLNYKDTLGRARLFSISSSPNDKEKISIIFRTSESGFKKTLLNTTIGSELEVEGPWGSFALPKDSKKPIVFVAGGTGIAPFLSMIRFATEEKLPHKITLLYSFRNKKNVAYFSEFKKLISQNPKIKIFPTTGLIKEKFIQEKACKNSDALFYISGPKAMRDLTWSVLLKNKIAEADIYYEEWIGLDLLNSTLMRNMFEITTDAIFFTDIAGIIRYVNPAWEKLSGWSSSEIVNKVTPRIQKSGKQNLEFYKNIWSCHLNGEIYKHDMINKRKDGSLYEIDHLYLPLFSASKQIVGFAAFQREISEEKRKLYEQTKTILASIGEGLAVVDNEGKILMVNKVFEESLGYHNVVGKRYFEVWQMEDNEKKNLPLKKRPLYIVLHENKSLFTDNYFYVGSDSKSIPVAITASPLSIEGRVLGAVVVFRDISKEKEIDKAKTEFVSLASHQLHTPLSTVNWYAEMLLAGDAGKITPDQKKYLEEIYTSNQRMVELVNSLLNVSRLELGIFTVQPRPTDVSALIRSVISDQKSQINEKKIKISSSFENNIPNIPADLKLLRMVVQNLLSNAVKYTPEGGKVELSLSLDKEKKHVLMKVSDTGYGIPKNQQDKIFSKFFRADNVRGENTEGTGLGLYIVKSIIEQSGGKIWFESPAFTKVSEGKEKNPGTTFYVTLPLEGMKKKEGTSLLLDKYART